MVGKVLAVGAAVVMSLGGWQAAAATDHADDADHADHADHVEACAPTARPFACAVVDREVGEYRSVEACAREPRRGKALVTPRWVCVRSQPAVARVEDGARRVDAVVCNSEPPVGCTDYDETKSDVLQLADLAEDRTFQTVDETLTGAG